MNGNVAGAAGAAGDEAELLARVRAGSAPAAEELVHRHAGPMLAVARRFFRNEQDAADAVQDALLQAFRSLDRFAGESKLSTWLHRITVNACLMKLRAKRSRPEIAIDSLLPDFDGTGHHRERVSRWPNPEEVLDQAERIALVRRCIEQLPENYRVVLLLRDIEELDTLETAERLDLTESAVKVRLHRARQALRTLLDRELRGGTAP